MDPSYYFAAFAGLMVGFLVMSRTLKWLIALWVVAKERKRDPAHRSHWRVAAVIFLNSGPWLLIAVITMGIVTFHRQGWSYFFGGVLVGLLIQGSVAAWYLRKIQKIRAQQRAAKGIT